MKKNYHFEELCNHAEMKDTIQTVQRGPQDSPSTTTQSTANHNISNTNSSAPSNHNISNTNSNAPSNDLRDKFQQNSTPELCSNVPEDLLHLKVT